MWTDKLPKENGWHWVKYLPKYASPEIKEKPKTHVAFIDVQKSTARFNENTYHISSGIVISWWDTPLKNPEDIYCDDGYKKIEISFPFSIQITRTQEMLLTAIIDDLCYMNCPPGYTMWLGGVGSKITYLPMTAEEEKIRGPEFDDDTLCFEISCRSKYDTDLKKPDKNLLDEILEIIQRIRTTSDITEKEIKDSLEKVAAKRLALRKRYKDNFKKQRRSES